MNIIGFATEYYTLWEMQTEPVYITDDYGNHHLIRYKTNYLYICNISTSLDKTKQKYPDLTIDEGLRGKVRSFTLENTEEDLVPDILKFGKYKGKTIQDVVKTDLNYILWLIGNSNSATAKACASLPEIIQDNAKKEADKQAKIDSFIEVQSGLNEVRFLGNPNHKLGESQLFSEEEAIKSLEPVKGYYTAAVQVGENHVLNVLFKDVYRVEGMYPYNMAIINGKSVRLKNKKMALQLNVIYTHKNEWMCEQYATLKGE